MADGVKFMQTLSVSTFMAEEPAGLREHEQITSVAESERMLNEARECRSAAERRLNEASGSRNEAARMLNAFMKINPTDFTSAGFVKLSELLASEQRYFDAAADRYERSTALNEARLNEASGSRNEAARMLNAFMKINPTDFTSAGFVALSASEQRCFDAAAAAVERHATLFAAAQTKYADIPTSQNSGNFLAL